MYASKPGKRIIADVPGHRLPDGGTAPPELVPTTMRPDILAIDPVSAEVNLCDLTSCADRQENIDKARVRKSSKYAALVSDIAATGVNAAFTPFEVCALGNIRGDSRATLRSLVGKRAARRTFQNLAKIAISFSYYIFNRRRSPEWESPSLFERAVD